MTLILLSIFSLLPHHYEVAYEDTSIDIETKRVEFQDYLPLKPIAGLLGLHYVHDNTTQRLLLSTGERKLLVIGDIATMMCNGVAKNLVFPPLYIGGDIYFPTNEIIPTLGGIFDKLIFIKEIKEAPLINNISLTTRGDSTVLKFDWQLNLFTIQF